MQKESSKHMGQSRLKFKSSRRFVRVKYAMKQLQKCFLCFLNLDARECNSSKKITDEVKPMEGHFPVLAIGNGEAKKFLVALSYLAYPPFVELLEAAEQEFEFHQPGVLVIQCEANELQRILLRKIIGN